MTLRRGMTLLELIVAMAIGGAALAAGGAVFATLTDRRAALLADVAVDERALTARRLLVTWLAETHASAGTDAALIAMRGSRRTSAGEVPDDTVSFLTTANGDARRVRLYVDRAGRHPTLVAAGAEANGDSAPTPLAVDVDGFEASFLTSAFGRREWRRGWNGGALMPEAIVLRLHPTEGVPLPSALQLPITIPLGLGR